MENNIIAVILGSSVVTVLLTNIFGNMESRKKSVLENIVLERKKWRDGIREICIEINTYENKEKLKLALCKLKVNINAYGINNFDQYMLDGHIWGMIKKIESEKNYKNLELYKNALSDMLSALLKFDWERSKTEIQGNFKIRAIIASNILCMILGILSNIYYLYFNNHDVNTLLINKIIIMMCAVSGFTIGVYYLMLICAKFILEELKSVPFRTITIFFIIMFGSVLWTIYDNLDPPQDLIDKYIGTNLKVSYRFQIVGMIISGLILLVYITELYFNRRYYHETIKEILKKYNIYLSASIRK